MIHHHKLTFGFGLMHGGIGDEASLGLELVLMLLGARLCSRAVVDIYPPV
jgi:hypothetical protein